MLNLEPNGLEIETTKLKPTFTTKIQISEPRLKVLFKTRKDQRFF
jgi:hypothetical protein